MLISNHDIFIRFTPGGSNSDPLKDKEITYNSDKENSYRPSRDVSPESGNPQTERDNAQPKAPQRSSSFGKVPNKRPHSPSTLEVSIGCDHF